MTPKPSVKEIAVVLFFSLNALFITAAARAEEQEIPPPGMDLLQVGATQVLVPAGTKITKKDGLIILENIAEYVARQIDHMNKQIDELKEENRSLKKELQAIRQSLSGSKETGQ
jgi:demethoxyubiquinone hydroxylase (CLK1/Coq7/Cat5 family)